MTLIPCGIDPDRFATAHTRESIRARFGIKPGTFVVLSVAAINRGHKRTHHLIEEVASLQGDVLLWLDGSLDHGDPGLLSLARERLGSRCLITHLPSDEVGQLFRAADCMAHAALFEAFGLSVVEAVASGVPVIVHDAPHFRWLVPNEHCWLDMSTPGVLAARLAELVADRRQLTLLSDAEAARGRFGWDRLAPDYIGLYRRVAEHHRVGA
jgi:glycosyltransferase involved in cell wall biosynthesis